MRKLKYHEQKLLKKVNFLEWEDTNTRREQAITAKYLLKSREEYKFYSRLVGMIRKLAESLSRLADNDHTKMFVAKKLVSLLFDIGIIENKKLIDCTKVGVSSLCQRRLPMVMVHKKLVPGHREADTFVQQGHVRLGNRVISDTSTLVSKAMEDFVTWTEASKIRKKIDEFNDRRLPVCLAGYMSLLPLEHRPRIARYTCTAVLAPEKPMPEISHSGYEAYLGRPVVVLLRNNRYVYGVLKSYDQYHSVSLNNAVERVFHGGRYAERSHGLIVLRGENISLVGTGRAFNAGNRAKADFDRLVREIEEAAGAGDSACPLLSNLKLN